MKHLYCKIFNINHSSSLRGLEESNFIKETLSIEVKESKKEKTIGLIILKLSNFPIEFEELYKEDLSENTQLYFKPTLLFKVKIEKYNMLPDYSGLESPVQLPKEKVKKKSILKMFSLERKQSLDGKKNFNSIPNQDRKISLDDNKIHLIDKKVFGIDIHKVCEREKSEIPRIFYLMIEFLFKNNAQEEKGIFRISVKKLTLEELQNQFDQGDYSMNNIKDLNIIACLLKQYLRMLPNPLFTFELFHPFLKMKSIENESDKIKEMKRLIQLLPNSNKNCLGILLKLLYEIQKNYLENMMNANNLAIVFGVTTLKFNYKNDITPSEIVKDAQQVTLVFEELILSYPNLKDEFNKFDF